MTKGTIVRLNDKGFGFIKVEGNDKDIFFHSSEFNGAYDSLNEGDTVEFELSQGEKGPQATKVNLVA
jgi:CspA family cold shock protein